MRCLVVWVMVMLLASSASAQPGPGPDLAMAVARRLEADYVAATRAIADARSAAEHIGAKRALWDSYRELGRFMPLRDPAAGGPMRIDPGAVQLIDQVFPQEVRADVQAATDRALQACVAEVRRLHALGPDGLHCLGQGHFVPDLWIPLPPSAFLRGDANASAAYFERTRQTLRDAPQQTAVRVEVAAMLVATTAYAEALALLEQTTTSYEARLLRAVSSLQSGNMPAARREIDAAIALAEHRPEAYFTSLSLLQEARRLAHEPEDPRSTTIAKRHFGALRCTLPNAVLPPPDDLDREVRYLDRWREPAHPCTAYQPSSEPTVAEEEIVVTPAPQPAPVVARGCGHCSHAPPSRTGSLAWLGMLALVFARRSAGGWRTTTRPATRR